MLIKALHAKTKHMKTGPLINRDEKVLSPIVKSFCNLSLANDFMCTVVFFIEDYKIEDYPTDFTPKN